MHFLPISFYLLSAFVLAATVMAVTRRSGVHAVVYLILSLVGVALLFYLLGAPMLAALQVILYAGGIMVLFLFVVMLLKREHWAREWTFSRYWLLPVVISLFSGVVMFLLISADSGSSTALPTAQASPLNFGKALFRDYWLGVELLSFLLLVALVGALYLGRKEPPPGGGKKPHRGGGQ